MFIRNILPLVILLLAAASAYIYVYPKYQGTASLKGQESKYDSALETANQVTSLSQTISENIESIPEEDKKTLDLLLPTDVNQLKMGNDILGIADFHNIDITSISFNEGLTADVASSNAAAPANIELQKMTVTLGFSARYQIFKSFLNDLEKSLQILDITEFSVAPTETEPYEYTVTLNTYWLPSGLQ